MRHPSLAWSVHRRASSPAHSGLEFSCPPPPPTTPHTHPYPFPPLPTHLFKVLVLSRRFHGFFHMSWPFAVVCARDRGGAPRRTHCTLHIRLIHMAAPGHWQRQYLQVDNYKADTTTPLFSWAWGKPPVNHIRVNLPNHTITAEVMWDCWLGHDAVLNVAWRKAKAEVEGNGPGHYSQRDMEVCLSNNAVVICGVSTHTDPPNMQHVWLSFGKSCGNNLEKKMFASTVLFDLLDVNRAIGGVAQPVPPTIGGVAQPVPPPRIRQRPPPQPTRPAPHNVPPPQWCPQPPSPQWPQPPPQWPSPQSPVPQPQLAAAPSPPPYWSPQPPLANTATDVQPRSHHDSGLLYPEPDPEAPTDEQPRSHYDSGGVPIPEEVPEEEPLADDGSPLRCLSWQAAIAQICLPLPELWFVQHLHQPFVHIDTSIIRPCGVGSMGQAGFHLVPVVGVGLAHAITTGDLALHHRRMQSELYFYNTTDQAVDQHIEQRRNLSLDMAAAVSTSQPAQPAQPPQPLQLADAPDATVATDVAVEELDNEMCVEFELCRVSAPHLQRSQCRGRWAEARTLAVGSTRCDSRMHALCAAMEGWLCARKAGVVDFLKVDFIKLCHRFELRCMKQMTAFDADIWDRHTDVMDRLVSDMPANFSPKSHALREKKKALSDMFNLHAGEIRQISGDWVPLREALENVGLWGVVSIPNPEEERNVSLPTYLGGRVGGHWQWVGG